MDIKNNKPYQTTPVNRSIVAAAGVPRRSTTATSEAPIRVLVAWPMDSTLGVGLPWLCTAPDIHWLEPAVLAPRLLLSALKRQRPDVLLLAEEIFYRLDDDDLAQLRTQFEELRVLLVAQAPTADLFDQVLRCRLHGILPANCPPDACPSAVRAVCQGEIWLSRALLSKVAERAMDARIFGETRRSHRFASAAKTPGELSRREQEIVMFVRQGLTNKEIAGQLDIMEDTVKKHLQNVFRKLGVRRRTLVALNQALWPPKTT